MPGFYCCNLSLFLASALITTWFLMLQRSVSNTNPIFGLKERINAVPNVVDSSHSDGEFSFHASISVQTFLLRIHKYCVLLRPLVPVSV